MQTAVVSIKVDPQVKKKAQEVAARSGFSLSVLINDYLKKIARTNSLETNLEEPNDYFIKSMKKSEADVKAGRVISFNSWEEEKEYLQKLIDNDKKKSG